MDPLFDRLGRLIRSMGVDSRPRSTPSSSDPLEQEAEDELEEFLRTGREAPKRPSTQGARSYQEQRKQESTWQAPPRPALDPAVARAYGTLGLQPSTTWEEINVAHRGLLKKYHPDRHAGNPELLKQATTMSQKINEAYQVLKKHLGR